MKKGMTQVALLLFALLTAIFLISLAKADTTVTVETNPAHLVSIEFADTTKYMSTIRSFLGNSSAAGLYSATYTGNTKFYLKMFVSDGNEFVVPVEIFGPYEPGENLKFVLKKGIQEQVIEEPECEESWTCGEWTACSKEGSQTRDCAESNGCDTAKNKPAESQECEPPKNALTGFIIDVKDKTLELNDKVNWMYVLYTTLGVVLIGGIVMFIKKRGHAVKKILVFKHKEEDRGDSPDLNAFDIRRIEEAEKKIDEAKQDIDNLKNSANKELVEAELNFEEAKKKLEEIKSKRENKPIR